MEWICIFNITVFTKICFKKQAQGLFQHSVTKATPNAATLFQRKIIENKKSQA